MKDFDRSFGHQTFANFRRTVISRDELVNELGQVIIKNSPQKPKRPIRRAESPINRALNKGAVDPETMREQYNFIPGYLLTPDETREAIAQRMREQAEKYLRFYKTGRRPSPPWLKFAARNHELIAEVRREQLQIAHRRH